jgi:hypothetical protein
MIWPWIDRSGKRNRHCRICPIAQNEERRSYVIGMGVVAGAGVTFLINACLEVISYVRSL